MKLYRASPQDGVAWITGASTGIGRQLALDLAAQGYTVAASARDQEGLVTLAGEAEARGGRIVSFLCDVTDENAVERTVARIEREIGPIVLAIFNAGTYAPNYGERLETHNFVSVLRVNLFGAIFGLVPVADRMRDRGFGQIALIGSVTSYLGLPTAAAYCASKSALNSIAQALRYDFDKLNIRLQIVNPGFVATQMTSGERFPKPGLITVSEASRRIRRGLASGGFEIAFPRRLIWPVKLLTLLPNELVYRAVRLASRWDKRRFGHRSKR